MTSLKIKTDRPAFFITLQFGFCLPEKNRFLSFRINRIPQT